MKDFNLSRFIIITVVAVVILSVAWNFVGKSHTSLMAYAIRPVLSEGIHLDVRDNTIRITARRDIIPVEYRINRDEQNVVIARSDVVVSDPAIREFWFSKLPDSTAQSYTSALEPRVLQSVLITAFALMLGLPGMSLKRRSVGLILVYILGSSGQLIGLYLIALRYQWLANNGTGGWSGNDAMVGVGYHFAMFAPLLIFIPILFLKSGRDFPTADR